MAKVDLLGILYFSEALQDLDASQLYQLTEHSHKKNSQKGITGFLHYEEKHFLQYIEGESTKVRDLMDTIASDERHSVSYFHPLSISKRKFPSWHMKQVAPYQSQPFQVEHLLMEILEMMKSPQVLNADYKERMILRMLDRLSASQDQLSVH